MHDVTFFRTATLTATRSTTPQRKLTLLRLSLARASLFKDSTAMLIPRDLLSLSSTRRMRMASGRPAISSPTSWRPIPVIWKVCLAQSYLMNLPLEQLFTTNQPQNLLRPPTHLSTTSQLPSQSSTPNQPPSRFWPLSQLLPPHLKLQLTIKIWLPESSLSSPPSSRILS